MANASLRILSRAAALGLIRGSTLSLRGSTLSLRGLYSVEKLAPSQLLSHLLGAQSQGSGYLHRVPDLHFKTWRLYSRGRRAEITDEEDAGDENGDLSDDPDEEWAEDDEDELGSEDMIDIVECGTEDDENYF